MATQAPQGLLDSGDSETYETPTEEAQLEHVFETSRTLGELFTLLKNQPEDAALATLQSIRQGHSPAEILQSTAGDLSNKTHLSPHATSRSMIPPTQIALEYHLVVRHPNVYPQLVPLDTAFIDLELLGIRPFGFDKTSRETPFLSRVQGPLLDQVVDPQAVINKAPDDCVVNHIDPRLRYIDISRWTSIKISNRLAGEAIALIPENQPAVLGLFRRRFVPRQFV